MRGVNIRPLNHILSEVYVEFNVPSDDIGFDTPTKATFADLVRERVLEELTDDNIAKTLINQRKAGHLPKIRACSTSQASN